MPWSKDRTPYAGSGWAWQRLRTAVLQRDGYVCRWCGGRATTADHVQARAHGGQDTQANLVASCAPCNDKRRIQQSRIGKLLPRSASMRSATRW